MSPSDSASSTFSYRARAQDPTIGFGFGGSARGSFFMKDHGEEEPEWRRALFNREVSESNAATVFPRKHEPVTAGLPNRSVIAPRVPKGSAAKSVTWSSAHFDTAISVPEDAELIAEPPKELEPMKTKRWGALDERRTAATTTTTMAPVTAKVPKRMLQQQPAQRFSTPVTTESRKKISPLFSDASPQAAAARATGGERARALSTPMTQAPAPPPPAAVVAAAPTETESPSEKREDRPSRAPSAGRYALAGPSPSPAGSFSSSASSLSMATPEVTRPFFGPRAAAARAAAVRAVLMTPPSQGGGMVSELEGTPATSEDTGVNREFPYHVMPGGEAARLALSTVCVSRRQGGG